MLSIVIICRLNFENLFISSRVIQENVVFGGHFLLLDTYLVVVQELKAHKIVSRKSQPLTVMVNELSLE